MCKSWIYVIFSLGIIVLSGCERTPSQVKRKVLSSEIVGKWFRGADSISKSELHIAFRADGTFEESARLPSGGTLVAIGTWNLEQNGYLQLKGCNIFFQKWEVQDAFWPIVESSSRPGKIGILGGFVSDPDFWTELTAIP